MPSVTTSSTSTLSASVMLFVIILASLATAGFGAIPTCVCPKDPIYVPLNRPTTVFVSALGNSSLLFATTSLPLFASNFSTKTGPVLTGSILPRAVNVSVTLTPLIAANGSITVSFTDVLTGSTSCTIYYIGYSGPTCTVLQTKLLVSVGEVFTATVIGFSPNSKLTAKASSLPLHTNGSIVTNTTLLSSVVVIAAVPGIPATEVINVQFFDQYGFNATCSVTYTVVVAGSTTVAPTAAPSTPAPTSAPTDPPTDFTEYTDYYPTYTTSPPTDAPTTQPPKPTTPNTPTCNAPASPVYLPIGLPTTIRVSVYGKHPLVVTTLNLPSFAQLKNGVDTILPGATLSASANVSVILQPILAINGSFSLVFADATDLLNSISTCAIRFITYTGPSCISANVRVLANVADNEANAYAGAIVGFSPISSLTVTTKNLPVGVAVAINNTLAPVVYAAAVSRSSALNSSATVYATFMDSYGFNATCFLNITAVANASLLVVTPTRRPTSSPTTSSPSTSSSITTFTPTTVAPTTTPTQTSTTAVPSTTTSAVTNAPTSTTASPVIITTTTTTTKTTTVPLTTSAATVATSSPTTATAAPTVTVTTTTSAPTQTSRPTESVATTAAPVTTSVTTNAATTTVVSTTAAPVVSTSAPTSAPSTTSVVTEVPTDAATTSTPVTSAPTQRPSDIVIIVPTETITVTIPTETVTVTIPRVTLPPVVIPPLSVCPASVHLVVGVTTTISVQVQAKGLVSIQAQDIPSFAQLSNSRGSIALGSAFEADENVTITFAPRASLDGSFTLSFVDQSSLLTTSCSVAYDVYSGPSCTVNQPSSSSVVVVGTTFTATVNGASSESNLAISSSSASTDFKLSTQNNAVTVNASPLSTKNESLSITFTDKYGLNATCTVSWKAIENILLPHNAATPTSFGSVFMVLIALVSVVML